MDYVWNWLLALLNGTGKLFLNPLFYYLFFLAAVLGVSRVKRERRNFHVRSQNAYFELRQLWPSGLLLGGIVSVLLASVGMVIPIGAILLIITTTILLSATTKIRLVSPAYIIGASFFALIFLAGKPLPIPFFSDTFANLDGKIFPSIGILIAILLMVEGILIIKNGSFATSPMLLKSKRGQWVGLHEAKRLWAVPIFLLVPGETLSLPFDWWPLFHIGGETYSFILVPFAIGFHQQIQSQLPKQAVTLFGKKVLMLGVFTTTIAIGGYWLPIITIAAIAFAMIGREMLTIRQHLKEENAPIYFSKRNNGIMILGILPHSPAEKMELKVGEVITKVNGQTIQNEVDFYEALHRNRAFCKLDVLDVNDQIRFVSSALYEGQHHELGVLFVSDQEKYGTKAV
ncbi:PDZ domain-containing protein [Pseudoneobacillus sp. C159]